MLQWLHKLSDESHASHQLAAHWHLAHALAYGVLVGLYLGAAIWHLDAADRHRKTPSTP